MAKLISPRKFSSCSAVPFTILFVKINENNTKKFSIERQRLQSRHHLQLEYLKKTQNGELQQITKLCDEVGELEQGMPTLKLSSH